MSWCYFLYLKIWAWTPLKNAILLVPFFSLSNFNLNSYRHLSWHSIHKAINFQTCFQIYPCLKTTENHLWDISSTGFFFPFFPGSWNPPGNFAAAPHYLHFVQTFRNRPFLTAAKNLGNKEQTVSTLCSFPIFCLKGSNYRKSQGWCRKPNRCHTRGVGKSETSFAQEGMWLCSINACTHTHIYTHIYDMV